MTSKRSRAKYKNLNPKLSLKRRQEVIDYDYLHKLNEEELDFLDKFTGEYVNCTVKRDKPEEMVHKSRDYIKPIEDANNAKNRDIYALKRCVNGLNYCDSEEMARIKESTQYAECDDFEANIIANDLFERDFELYKIELSDYINSIKNKRERSKELAYYLTLGYTWLLD